MRIGLAQMDILWENIEENKNKAETFFQEAKKQKTDIVVFPEMTLTGFSMNVVKTAADWRIQADFFREMSKKYDMTAVFGYPARISKEEIKAHPEWKEYQNHLSIMDRGKELLNYTKIHPFTYGLEARYFQGGERIDTAEWKDTVLGAFICYDLRFPEIFQVSSRKSEVIFVIANWPAERADQWNCLLQARAIENQSYVVGVNRTGDGGKIHYNGHSAVYGPTGAAMTKICEEEKLIVAEIHPETVRKYREEFPMKKDRREDLYRFYV